MLFGSLGVIWGIPYLLIRVAVREMSPGTLVFWRTMPAALALVALALHRGHLRPLIAHWRWLMVYTIVEIAVPWLLLSTAEERLTSSFSALLVASVPLIGVLLGAVSGRGRDPRDHGPGRRLAERVDVRRLTGLGVGLAGVAVLTGVDVRGSNMWSLVEVAVVAMGYAAGPLILSRELADLPALGVVSVSLALTAIAYAPWALSHPPRHVTAETTASIVGLAVFCTAIAFLLFYTLIAEIGPVRATVITYVNPAVALLLGVSLLGESFTLGLGLGFPLVLLGSFLATRSGPGSGAAVQEVAP